MLYRFLFALLVAFVMVACGDSGPANYPTDDPPAARAPDNIYVRPDSKPIDGDKAFMAKLGQEYIDAGKYEEIIALAEKVGWIKKVRVAQTQAPGGKKLVADVATETFVSVFTVWACRAGVAAVADSPAPGPGDALAIGMLVVGLVHAGYAAHEALVTAEHLAAATTTAVPTATATTTTTAPPIPLPRKYPNQTCDEGVRLALQAAMKAVCKGFPGNSCSQKSEKELKSAPVYPCSLIVARIAAVKVCVAARQKVQDVCFKNSPEPGHVKQIDDLTGGIMLCEALKLVNCASGHPMSGL